MNIQQIMSQAKKMQKDLEKISNNIDNTEFTVDNNDVKIIMKGNYSISKIEIKNIDLLSDKEMLEDILIVHMNSVLEKIKKEKESKLGNVTGGLGGLF